MWGCQKSELSTVYENMLAPTHRFAHGAKKQVARTHPIAQEGSNSALGFRVLG